MSLTKKDKEEIRQMIVEAIKGQGMVANEEALDVLSQIKDWKENAIDTGMGFKLAPADLEIDGKEYFTWDEAKEIEEKYLKPNGWRLPTVGEFVMLYGKYGIDEDGEDDVEAFCEALKIEKKGYKDSNGLLNLQDSYGVWWSTAASSVSLAYALYMLSSNLNPQGNNFKAYGFALRCVSLNDFSEQSMEEIKKLENGRNGGNK